MWECVLYLLPSSLLLFVAFLIQWTPVRLGLRVPSRWFGWRLWALLCWFLGLPLASQTAAEGPPQLVCKPTALARFLFQRCNLLAKPGPAGLPWGYPHFETVCSLAGPQCGSGGVRFARDHLQMQDGGVVALDWAVGLERELGPSLRKDSMGGENVLGCHSSCPPVLILVPNSWGRVTPHLLRLCVLALCQGFYPVVFHRRGQGGCPLVTPRFQEFGDPSDLVQAIDYIRFRHPKSVLVAVSEGSGSGVLLSYLGECGSSSYLTAAACLSPVLQGQLWFEMPFPALYRWGLLLYRKLQLSRYATALSSALNIEQLLCCSSLWDMEMLTFCSTRASSCTEADWEAYWERNEPLRDADEVAVPVLCLRSRDDPLLPPISTLPTALFRSSPYFLLLLSNSSGHCGASEWSHPLVLEYFRAVAHFLRAEEMAAGMQAAAARMGPRVGPAGTGPGTCRRTQTLVTRRRRAAQLRRDGSPSWLSTHIAHGGIGKVADQVGFGGESKAFTWHRCYTR
ncbi:protein ABHD15 [Scleropages formosus]|uniref:Abhydrolase domain containing 15 n=1 Tax=Scleropages formosus TaxID=113540 RepID=A0A8C9UZL5_SCLFO|nr:protein ABHD15 [Scleropages formosus]